LRDAWLQQYSIAPLCFTVVESFLRTNNEIGVFLGGFARHFVNLLLPSLCLFRLTVDAAIVNGYLTVVGGYGQDETGKLRNLNTAERWDPEAKKWIVLPKMLTEHNFGAAGAIHGKLVAVGGRNQDGWRQNIVELYDTDIQEWSYLPKLKEKRIGIAAAILYK